MNHRSDMALRSVDDHLIPPDQPGPCFNCAARSAADAFVERLRDEAGYWEPHEGGVWQDVYDSAMWALRGQYRRGREECRDCKK